MSRPRGGSNRNITITPKGLAMLAAIDAGTMKTISTVQAKAQQCRKLNAARRAKGNT